MNPNRFLEGGGDSGELSEGVGGTFGRLTLFDTATYQEPLNSNHSKAHNFKRTNLGGGGGEAGLGPQATHPPTIGQKRGGGGGWPSWEYGERGRRGEG